VAISRRVMSASPEAIFAVLSDPEEYAHWVVGSDTVRGYEGPWPAVGSRFHHRVGTWPVKIHDHTEVLEVDPPRRLVLRARARPLVTAIVTLDLEPRGDGTTLVTMEEKAGDPLSTVLINPLTAPLARLRNDVALRRLETRAWATAATGQARK
jgi:uncharacterized protein YndB with AHSA1/START domain